MKIQKVLVAIFGVFGFSLNIAGSMMASHPAQAAVQQCNGLSEEECCQLALEKNTIEALEEFLRMYPPGRGNSACSALALTALSEFGEHESHDITPPPHDGGYGN